MPKLSDPRKSLTLNVTIGEPPPNTTPWREHELASRAPGATLRKAPQDAGIRSVFGVCSNLSPVSNLIRS
jgi:hypothetical protein